MSYGSVGKEEFLERGWIGVDLDGTLAENVRWLGSEHVGKPIQVMVDRVKMWLSQGVRVKIFTARVSFDDYNESVIREWLKSVGLPEDLEITNIKDGLMEELWDDRCVQVKKDTGTPVRGSLQTRELEEILVELRIASTGYDDSDWKRAAKATLRLAELVKTLL